MAIESRRKGAVSAACHGIAVATWFIVAAGLFFVAYSVIPWQAVPVLKKAFLVLTFLSLVTLQAGIVLYGFRRLASARRRPLLQNTPPDALTGLPHLDLWREQVKEELRRAGMISLRAALFAADLDRFGNIVAGLGREAGDAVLRAVSERLRGELRGMDLVTRQYADRFWVFLAAPITQERVHRVANGILNAMLAPIEGEGQSLRPALSLGVALFPDNGESLEALMVAAETALHQAKNLGGNRYVLYSREITDRLVRRFRTERELREALDARGFRLHYQPQIELASGRLTGVEALLRWQHPKRGLVAPHEFIAVAEESGLIVYIGHWVLDAACRQAQRWTVTGLPPLRLAVNLSSAQLAQRDIVTWVAESLLVTGFNGRLLELEITESMAMQNAAEMMEVMHRLKKLGLSIAIDDFGTGYSSLAYLKRFPIDHLKIDRTFVSDIDRNAESRVIAELIVSLGHALGIRVIAEGIENAAQLEILKRMGCDEGQGYYFSRPLPVEEIETFIRAQMPCDKSHGSC